MEENYISPKLREPSREEISEMKFYLKTGCVHESYLERVLGDISIGVSAFCGKYISP